MTAGLLLVVSGIIAIDRHGLTSATTLGSLAAGVALLGLFVLVETRLAAAPLVPLRIVRTRGLAGASLTVFCLGGVAFSLWFLLTLHLRQGLGWYALRTGLAFAPMATGMAVLGAGMLLLAGADADAGWARGLLAPSLLCAAGIGASFVPASIAATSSAAATDSGLATGT